MDGQTGKFWRLSHTTSTFSMIMVTGINCADFQNCFKLAACLSLATTVYFIAPCICAHLEFNSSFESSNYIMWDGFMFIPGHDREVIKLFHAQLN